MEGETGSDETEWRAKPQGGCAQGSHPHGGGERVCNNTELKTRCRQGWRGGNQR